MMAWRAWFFIDNRKRNVIVDWLSDEKIPQDQIDMFQSKLDDFERLGPELMAGFISDTPVAPDAFKMKIKGNSRGWKQLRPMCCKGPFGPTEYTLLLGLIERDNKLPKGWHDKFQERLKVLSADRNRRVHERISDRIPKA